MTDLTQELQTAVASAARDGQAIYLQGGNTKRNLLGRECNATALSLSNHRGIIDYQPAELFITARAGTPLTDIEQTLAENNQTLACESPYFGGAATLGGTLACNLSGPGRPWYGAIRDLVLGLKLINGKGELLNFGGTVMKNVAGYDVSRLQAGALGSLGLISQATLKVSPRPEAHATLSYDMPASTAIRFMNERAGTPKPLSAAAWFEGRVYLRLSGAEAAVRHTAQLWGGECEDEAPVWDQIRELSLPCIETQKGLWRLSCSPTASLTSAQPLLMNWCGAQRWYGTDSNVDPQTKPLAQGIGHWVNFKGGDRMAETNPLLDPVQTRLHRKVKQAMDPAGVFNPGRLYSWM
ncbi:MAG: glycolate oxidase subunit GlcE [Halioglobus sp.]